MRVLQKNLHNGHCWRLKFCKILSESTSRDEYKFIYGTVNILLHPMYRVPSCSQHYQVCII